MSSDTIKCRYQLGDPYWYLTTYNNPPKKGRPLPANAQGVRGEEPEWLKPILTVAAAGDHYMHPVDPPPYKVLWFQIDRDLNLVKFGYD